MRVAAKRRGARSSPPLAPLAGTGRGGTDPQGKTRVRAPKCARAGKFNPKNVNDNRSIPSKKPKG